MHELIRYRRRPILFPLIVTVLILASGAQLSAADPPPKVDPNDGQWAVGRWNLNRPSRKLKHLRCA